MNRCLILACLCTLLAACGKKPAPAPETPPAAPIAAAPAVTPAAAPAPPPDAPVAAKPPPAPGPGPEVEEDPFTIRLNEVLALERDAKLGPALSLCRKMKTEFPETKQRRIIEDLARKLNEEKKLSAALPFAIKGLGSDNVTEVDVAKAKLLDAEEAGLIFLRHAVRTQPEPIAAVAAATIGEGYDDAGVPVLVERVGDDIGRDFVQAIAGSLKTMAAQIAPEDLLSLLETIGADKSFAKREVAGVLETVYRKVCASDAEKFNELCGRPTAMTDLRAYVERAVVAGNPELAAWVCTEGGEFVGLVNGLHGFYYADEELKRLAFERFDLQAHFEPGRHLVYPDGRQEHVSVRWRGFIDVPGDGEFSFYLYADTRASLLIDDVRIIQGPCCSEHTAKATLTKGRHELRIEYVNATGNNGLKLHWEGPGLEGRRLVHADNKVYHARPWAERLADMTVATTNLVSTNWPEARAARALFRTAGSTGRIFLRDAVANRNDAVAVAALERLVEQRDPRTPPILEARLADDPNMPVAAEFERALVALVQETDPARFPEFMTRVQSEEPGDMSFYAAALCAAFDRVAGREAAAFNTLVGNPDGHATLAAHVRAALRSADRETVYRASELGVPLAPELPGLRARYYRGHRWDELANDRLERRVQTTNRVLPIPDNRQDDIAVLWTGLLDIKTPGDYTFFPKADYTGRFWLDNDLLATVGSFTEKPVVRTLTKGYHSLRFDFNNGSSAGANSRVELQWSGPGVERQPLTSDSIRVGPWRSELERLGESIDTMTSTNWATVEKGRLVFRHLDPVSRPYLRNVCRLDDMPKAGEAARMLVELGDPEASRVFIERLDQDPPRAVQVALAESLVEVVEQVDAKELARFLQEVEADKTFARRAKAAALCAVLNRVCNGDAKKFDTLLGQPGAHDSLAEYVKAGLRSEDDAVAADLLAFGQPFVPPVRGLRGRHYEGRWLDRLANDRLESSAYINNREFPIPGGRQDNVSTVMDGYLNVEKAGDYTFQLYGEDWADLWVDGKKLARSTAWGIQKPVAALTAGRHAIRVQVSQSTGNGRLDLSWSGPGMDMRRLDTRALSTDLWPAKVARLSTGIGELASTNVVVARTARTHLRRADPASRPLLYNAIRYRSADVVAPAIQLLADRNDPMLAEVMMERLKKEPAVDVAALLVAGLRTHVAHLEPSHVPWLFTRLKADADATVNAGAAVLCAVAERLCGNDAVKFNAMAKSPTAYAELAAYFDRALRSSDIAVVSRASQFGQPFVPHLPGLHGTYFVGWDHDTLMTERQDRALNLAHGRNFPFPTEQQDDVSLRWEGFLETEKPGEYTFFLHGDDNAVLRLDGEVALKTASAWTEAKVALNLTAGRHAIRVDLAQRSGNSGCKLEWAGPDIARTSLPAAAFDTEPWPARMASLAASAGQLTSTNLAALTAARADLTQGYPVSGTILRHVVRHGTPALAEEAMRLLVQFDDAATASLLLEELQKDPSGPQAPARVRALSALIHHVPGEDVQPLLAVVKADKTFAKRNLAAVLCAYVDGCCNGDEAKLGLAVKDPKAGAALRQYVDDALAAKDLDVVSWACEFGGPFAPAMTGARLQLFDGRNFEEPVHELLVNRLQMDNTSFPMPDKRQTDLSARWSGWLEVPTTGEYVFTLWGEDWATLWIDDKSIATSRAYAEVKGTALLTQGRHRVRIDLSQSTGNTRLELYWQGPYIEKQRVPGTALRTAAWPARLAEFEKARGQLSAAVAADREAARAELFDGQDVGATYMLHALRHDNEKVAAGMFAPLARRGGPMVATLLGDPFFAAPMTPAAASRALAVARVAGELDPVAVASLYKQFKADTAYAMTNAATVLCAVLDDKCGGDAKAFGALVKDPAAFTVMSNYVAKALSSEYAGRVVWALARGGRLAPLAPGLRAHVFEGIALDSQVAELRQPALHIANGQLPTPSKRQDNISMSSEGYLKVDKAGSYTFFVTADDGAALWLDGRKILDGWRLAAGQERHVAVELAPGLHHLRADYYQTSGHGSVTLYWSGPGIGKAVIPATALRSNLTGKEIADLADAAAKLGSTDAAAAKAAATKLETGGDAGRVFLRNTVRFGEDAAAVAAARSLLILKENDSARNLVFARLVAAPKSDAVGTYVEVLKSVADQVAPEQAAWVYGRLKDDGAFAMRAYAGLLCAILDGVCKGDAAAFNTLVKDPKGAEQLGTYVKAALESKDETVIKWAKERGGSLAKAG